MTDGVNEYKVITSRSALIILSILIFGVNLIDGLDSYMVNLATPEIQEALGFGISDASWIQNAYVIGIAAFLLLFAKLGDRGLCKALFLLGIAIFTVSSVFCAFSVVPMEMIIFRFLQGIGGSMMAGISPILVVRCFPKSMLGRGMALLALSTGMSIVLGPVLGGMLTEIDWRLIFFINVPVGIFLIILGFWKLPKNRKITSKLFPDTRSVIYVAFFLISALIFLENIVENAQGTQMPLWLSITSGVVCIIAFILMVARVRGDHPNALINRKLLHNWEFVSVTLSFLFTTMIAAGVNFLLPFWLKDGEIGWGMGPLDSGLTLMVSSVSMLVASTFAGRWCDKKGCKVPTTIAVLLRIVFSVFFLVMVPEWGLVPLIICLIIVGLSFGLSGASQPTRMNHHTEPKLRGEASAMMLVVNYVGTALGTVAYVLTMNLEYVLNTGLGFFRFPMIAGIIFGVAALICTLIVRNIVPEQNDTLE